MRLRLILSFGLVILITIGSVVWIVRQSTQEEVHTFMFRGGMMGLNGLVTNLESCYEEVENWRDCSYLLDEHAGRHGGMHGSGMGRSMGSPTREDGERQRIQLLDQKGTVVGEPSDSPSPGQYDLSSLTGAIPLRDGQEIAGYLLPENKIPFTSQQETELVSKINQAVWTSLLIAVPTALLLASYLTYQLTRPIRQLTRAAEALKKGDLSQRISPQGYSEIATLSRTFNQMASTLERSSERRKALTADIAHELRTPLSVQQAYIEAMQDGIHALDIENLQKIEGQNQALIRLVDDLRTLSLADAGELPLEQRVTDLHQHVEQVIHHFRPKAEEKHVSLEHPKTGQLPQVYVDPQRVEQIIINLLSNALRHTPQGSTITINLSTSGDMVLLSVRDQGEGVSEEEIPYLFQRFYKSDKSRQEEQGGTGLGLSISQKLAQAHGGRIEVSNHPEGGAVFTLHIPTAE